MDRIYAVVFIFEITWSVQKKYFLFFNENSYFVQKFHILVYLLLVTATKSKQPLNTFSILIVEDFQMLLLIYFLLFGILGVYLLQDLGLKIGN